jgi:hypothetical protein
VDDHVPKTTDQAPVDGRDWDNVKLNEVRDQAMAEQFADADAPEVEWTAWRDIQRAAFRVLWRRAKGNNPEPS